MGLPTKCQIAAGFTCLYMCECTYTQMHMYTHVCMLTLTLSFPVTASVIVSLFLCCDLNVKSPPWAPVFEHLIYNRQSCFGRLRNLEKVLKVAHWMKQPWGWALKLDSLTVFSARVPLPGSSHNVASHLRHTAMPCHDEMNL